MNRTIFIEKKAILEIREADQWYFKKSILASEHLEKEFYEMMDVLRDETRQHRIIMGNVRMLPMKIFPYNIYYINDTRLNTIRIIAFLHTKRNPDFITKRLHE